LHTYGDSGTFRGQQCPRRPRERPRGHGTTGNEVPATHRESTPAELHLAAVRAEDAATALARAVGAATTAGLIVDDEITECTATVTSWAAWVTATAAAAVPDRGGQRVMRDDYSGGPDQEQ
jgi:hypothetical protein